MKMKKKLFGTVTALLAVLMLTQGVSAAFSSSVLDAPTYTLSANGFRYREATVVESGTQKLFYGEYNASTADAQYEWVIHSIRDGSTTTKTTVMDIAKDYEAQTGKKVIFAANGDYFDLNTGTNMESYVNDGIVITKGAFAQKHCIGFDNNGKVVIGRMTEVEKRLMIVLNGQRYFFNIDAYNKDPGENGIAIYSTPGTYTVEGAGKYICTTDSTNLANFPVWGSSYRLTEGEGVTNDDAFTIRSGQFAIVIRGDYAQYFYDNIKYGVEVDLVELPAGEFAGCTWVLGGYDILVDDGVVNTKTHTDNDGSGKAPRTLIGFKEDGTAFLCMLDGRGANGSTGITVTQEAQLAKALGAKYALELDGGGSTTVIVRINDQLTLRNKPSDGSMRKVSNAIMLVEKSERQEITTPDPTPSQPTEPTQPTTPGDNNTSSASPTGDKTPVAIAAVVGAVVIVGAGTLIVAKRKRKK